MGQIFVLFGQAGLLGKTFHFRLCDRVPDYRVFAFEHRMIDITQISHVRPILDYIKPTVVINCAGESALDLCENAKQGAFLVNARGPEILAQECERVGAKLVQMSTYHVFDGKRKTPYNERSTPNPLNVFGSSKWDGELAIKKLCPNSLVIRLSWPFHHEGDNLLSGWISRAERGSNLLVRGNCRFSPVFVLDAVEATLTLVESGAKGIFNVANEGEPTFRDIAQEMIALCSFKGKVTETTMASQPWFKVPIPAYGVLSTEKYNARTGNKMRHWKDALKQTLFLSGRYLP